MLFLFSFPRKQSRSLICLSSRADACENINRLKIDCLKCARKRFITIQLNYFHVSWDQRKSTCNTDCYRSDIKQYFTSSGKKLEISVAERTEMDIEVPFYLMCVAHRGKTFVKMKSESENVLAGDDANHSNLTMDRSENNYRFDGFTANSCSS